MLEEKVVTIATTRTQYYYVSFRSLITCSGGGRGKGTDFVEIMAKCHAVVRAWLDILLTTVLRASVHRVDVLGSPAVPLCSSVTYELELRCKLGNSDIMTTAQV